MNAVRKTGVPESYVPRTTDRHEEKSGDSVIQYICMLRGTVQVNVQHSRVSKTRDDYSTQSTCQEAQ